MFVIVMNLILWSLMLFKDTREYVYTKKNWGKGHITYTVVDSIMLGITVYVLVKGVI